MNVQIAEYKPEDIEYIKNLLVELQDVLKGLEPETIAAGDKVRDSYTEDLINRVKTKDGQVFLAKDSGRVVGLVAVYINHEKDEDINYLFFSDFVVSESERGKGIGKQLLKAEEQNDKDKNLKYIRIAALASNTRAAKLYKEMGFKDYAVTFHKKL